MGLLPYLTAHAMDEDYEHAAERRRRTRPEAAHGPQRRRRIGMRGAVVIALFALLVVTAAVQTSRNAVAAANERRDLVTQVRARKQAFDDQRQRLLELQVSTTTLRRRLLERDQTATAVLARVDLLSIRAGTLDVQGPGVRVRVDDALRAVADPRLQVLDVDLQKLVNGLWQAGAEAISINGQRLTTLSAIRHAGDAITVNYRSLSRPYLISAVGDPDTLPARFANTTSGQAWLDLQAKVGLEYDMTTRRTLDVPAARTPTLRYAEAGTDQKGTR